MQDERLIELVRENRVLYDTSHPKYMDSKCKVNLWNEIGSQMEVDGETCKVRWNNIRDNYRKSLKKSHNKNGQRRPNVKLYRYYKQLGFLEKYVTDRNKNDGLDVQEGSRMVVDEEVDQTHNSAPVYKRSRPNASPSSHISSQSPSYVSQEDLSIPPPSKKKRDGIDPEKTAEYTLIEYILQKNKSAEESLQHPVNAFLNGIAPTLKCLNRYCLHLAKSEIFATVQKYEMKMMTEQNVTTIQEVVASNTSTETNPILPQSGFLSQSISNPNLTAVTVEKSEPNVPNLAHSEMSEIALVEYILQKNKAAAESSQQPVNAFLNGVAPTLKTLNQYYLHLAKSEIFATAQKYELKMMTEQNVTIFSADDASNTSTETIVLQSGFSSHNSNPTSVALVKLEPNVP